MVNADPVRGELRGGTMFAARGEVNDDAMAS